MSHYKHYLQSDNPEGSLLHVELLPGQTTMNFKIKGDPVAVSKMIAHAMDARQDIAAAMIAAVFAWADENKIPRDQLINMVKFYPPKT